MGFAIEKCQGKRGPVPTTKVAGVQGVKTSGMNKPGDTCGCTNGGTAIGSTRNSSGKSPMKAHEVSGKGSGTGRPGQTSGRLGGGRGQVSQTRGR